MNMLIRLFEQYGYLSPLCKEALEAHIVTYTVKKGDVLLQKGQLSSYLYVLEEGLVCGFYECNKQRFDTWFAFKHAILNPTYQLFKSKVSLETIQCLENSVVHAIPNQILFRLFSEFPELNVIVRRAIEDYCLELQERNYELKTMTPHDRYHLLSRQLHGNMARLPHTNLASYLGVSVDLVHQWIK